MALSATSKNQINNLLALLQTDFQACAAVNSAAERLLSPTNAAHVQGVLGKNANGSNQATQQTALTTLLADVAAN